MAFTRFASRFRVHVELALPLAGQKNVPSGVCELLFPLPGRIVGSVFQVMAFSFQLLLLSKSNSKLPAAIRLKLALPGCWPAVGTLEKRVNETQVTTQPSAPKSESSAACS